MGIGWKWAGDIGEKGMQILVAVRRELCSPNLSTLPKMPKIPKTPFDFLAVAPPLCVARRFYRLKLRRALNGAQNKRVKWPRPFMIVVITSGSKEHIFRNEHLIFLAVCIFIKLIVFTLSCVSLSLTPQSFSLLHVLFITYIL